MTSDSSEAISQARNYLQQGDAAAAQALLAKFVRQRPESEEGWLLLSQTLSDARQKADCLRQVLKINPTNEQARQQIEALQPSKAAPLQPTSLPFTPGSFPAKVYVEKSAPEPGLDFWEEDETVISTTAESAPPAAHPSPTPAKIEQSVQRPAEPLQASVPPAELVKPVPPFKSGPFAVSTSPEIPNPLTGVEAVPTSNPAEPVLPSFAPDIEQAAPEAKLVAQEKPRPPKNDRQAAQKEARIGKAKPKQKTKRSLLPVVIIGVVLVMIVAAVIGIILVTNYFSAALIPPTEPEDFQQALNNTQPAPTSEPAFALPPSWTPTATWTLAPTSTATPVTPTPLPSGTPTPIPPPATELAIMESIQADVSAMRGLPVLEQIQTYIIPPLIFEQTLTKEYLDEAAVARLTDEARVLSALGLIKPGYDLKRFSLNRMVDNFGGYYDPESKTIYILEWSLGATERYIYAHEVDHALLNQHYNIASLQSQENCSNEDRCAAIKALIEGDATLTMDQWLTKVASPEIARQLRKYRIPDQAFKESFPPDYVIQSLSFPYHYGKIFVQELFNDGNWKRVNQAYGQLPQSTEQIMHPEKYGLGEAPVPVEDLPLLLVLGEEWRMIKTNTLGEWDTFLMLAYGVEKLAKQAVKDAQAAATGWGGNHYQVYYNANSEQTTLAAHWVWDTDQDAQEFAASMQAYLAARFFGSAIMLPAGMCWEHNSQTTCFYSQGNQSLWLLAPDQAILDLALSLYPQFQNP